jgi:hypothetical protein
MSTRNTCTVCQSSVGPCNHTPTERACEVCHTPTGVWKWWPYIQDAEQTGPFMYACAPCFHAVWAGEA